MKQHSFIIRLYEHMFIVILNLKRESTKTQFLVIHPLKLTNANQCLVNILLSTLFSLKQSLLNHPQFF